MFLRSIEKQISTALMPVYRSLLFRTSKLFMLFILGVISIPFLILGLILIISLSLIIIPVTCIFLAGYILYLSVNRFAVSYIFNLLLSSCITFIDYSPAIPYPVKVVINICTNFINNSPPIPYLVKVVFNTCANHFNKPLTRSDEYKALHGDTARDLDVDMNLSECSSDEESEKDDFDTGSIKEEPSRKDHITNGDSWKTQFLNSFKHIDDKPFYQTLNFWRSKLGERS